MFDYEQAIREELPPGETGLVYSRFNGPNQQILEGRLAIWDGAEEALVFSSGMTAICVLMIGQSVLREFGVRTGAVNVNSGGTISPGTSIGTLTLNSPPTLNGTNFMEIDRNGGVSLADKLVLTSGTLNYGGTLVVSNAGAALTGLGSSLGAAIPYVGLAVAAGMMLADPPTFDVSTYWREPPSYVVGIMGIVLVWLWACDRVGRWPALDRRLGIALEHEVGGAAELHGELSTYLPPLLHRADRASMGASVELRVPFLDMNLVALAMVFEFLRHWNSTGRLPVAATVKSTVPPT